MCTNTNLSTHSIVGQVDGFQYGALRYEADKNILVHLRYAYAYAMLNIYVKLPDLKVCAHLALVNDAFQSTCIN